MNVQLVGGPYDGTMFEHHGPLAPLLDLLVLETEEDRDWVATVIEATGDGPSDDIAPTYERTTYRLMLRRQTGEPAYVFTGAEMHGEWSR